MALTAKFYNFSKRKNSTKQPTGTATDYQVTLKSGTSMLSPTFILNTGALAGNYVEFDGYYYFVDDYTWIHNDLLEVSCSMDVLASFKSDITARTFFVAYADTGVNNWLADTRIPVLKSTQVSSNVASMSGLLNSTGFYVLSVVGKTGCAVYGVNKSTLSGIIQEIQTWQDDGINAIVNDDMSLGYDFSSVEAAIESMSKMTIQTGFIGNAYANAPACIRSCIWVPFLLSAFTGNSAPIYLGNYDTTKAGFEVNADPATGAVSVAIPWQNSGWKRAICEDVYLYLPLVGMIQLSGDSITHASSVTVKYSATATDGCVCYEIICGGEIIGTYGGSCSANFPIGVNQQASAGEVANALMGGASKMVSAAINSSISPISAGAAVAGVAIEGVNAAYDTVNTANSTHVSCVGGIGGGAGVGLDLDVSCYTVNHPLNASQDALKATMGVPVMKSITLSGLSGYCQCANAHVKAAAPATVLDAIDYYLNSGFFIE